jgi:hypothetical protein
LTLVYEGNKKYKIDTFLDDPEDYVLKQTMMKDELRAIKRILLENDVSNRSYKLFLNFLKNELKGDLKWFIFRS